MFTRAYVNYLCAYINRRNTLIEMFDLRAEIFAILKVFLQYEVDSVYYVEFNIYRLIASELKIRWNCTKRKCCQSTAEARGLLFNADRGQHIRMQFK